MAIRESAGLLTPARRRRRGVPLRHDATVLLFLSPWLLGFALFTVYPMVTSLYLSFTHYDLLTPPQWVGPSNYQFMIGSDPYFWQSVWNTVWIVAIAVPIQVAFAIGCAVVLTRLKSGAGFYRTVFYLPTMVPIVAGTLGFVFLLNPVGPLDRLLAFVHLPQPLWFQDANWSKPGLTLLGMWGIGNTMIIFLAALLDVPRQLYEAAELEGASSWQQFRHITVPMISPVIFFSLVIGVIYGFQYFTEGFVAAGGTGNLGNPGGSLLFYGIWLYQQAFEYFHMGYASAQAWVLFVVILAFTLVLIRTSGRWVHYQGGFK